jgi:hypothetical protein
MNGGGRASAASPRVQENHLKQHLVTQTTSHADTSTEYHDVVNVCLQEDLRATSRKGKVGCAHLLVPVNLSGSSRRTIRDWHRVVTSTHLHVTVA